MSKQVVVIDYGMGNLRSVLNRTKAAVSDTVISSDPTVIASADKLILPGVGHFAKGMQNLKERGILSVLRRKVEEENTPILGICLGMQLFSKSSEEGDATGLGWIDATTRKFDNALPIKVPHMGWNTLKIVRNNAITTDLPLDEQFYFCHSFFFDCADPADIVTRTTYGLEFTSSVQRGNVYGVQFHPEKSHDWGAQLMADFLMVA